MSELTPKTRGMYFEEFVVGKEYATTGRTVTETDIVNFAGLSGDFNPIHTDAEFSAAGMFGQRVAHGLLVLSIATGLIDKMGMLDGTILAFREINTWKFSKPTFIGDTVHVVLKITETKPMRRLGGGVVMLNLDIKNQHDETVMKGTWTALMKSKPDAGD